MCEKNYIVCKDVAKIVRKVLKEKFSETKFSVRSKVYSGGSSIDVEWTDGPRESEVKDLVGHFHGASFDGMIDLKSYHDSYHNGEKVHFGNDYIFFRWNISDEIYINKANEILENFGYEERISTIEELGRSLIQIGGWYLRDFTYQELNKKEDYYHCIHDDDNIVLQVKSDRTDIKCSACGKIMTFGRYTSKINEGMMKL